MPTTRTFPGFVDVHVHFRDPGVPRAETTASGLAAASRGGMAAVVTMPNTSPACDSPEAIRYQLSQRSAATMTGECSEVWKFGSLEVNDRPSKHPNVQTAKHPNNFRPLLIPSACLTKKRLGKEVADLEALAEAGAAFFTDDGSYVADDKVMETAMRRAEALGMCVCQHAMDPKILAGGVIRDCALARKLGLPIIRPKTETAAIRRDLSLCRTTGCRLHVQHISTAAGVALVRDAQREGLPVTAEATPHHLLLTCDDLTADDANFKMAPPLGNREDRAELRRAVKDGVLMFATDHAPHPAETKSRGFGGSANGIIGLETAIPITYAVMVEEEGMSVGDWARAWWEMPRTIIGERGENGEKGESDLLAGIGETTVEIGSPRKVDVSSFASLSRNCPYDGMIFNCWPTRTMCG